MARRQPVDLGDHRGIDRRRQLAEVTLFADRAQQLVDEERVARRALGQRSDVVREERGVLGREDDRLGGLRDGQRRELDDSPVGVRMRDEATLGRPASHAQEGRRHRERDDPPQQPDRCLVHVLHVFEDEHGRACKRPPEEGRRHLVHPLASERGLELCQLGGIGDVEVERCREQRHQREQFGRHRFEALTQSLRHAITGLARFDAEQIAKEN